MYEATGMRYRGQRDGKEKQEQRKGKERKEKGDENLGNVEDVEMEYFLGKQTVISIFF